MGGLFFSYSRKDIGFARKLTEAFSRQDLDFWIDWESIPPTVAWWEEIKKGIEEADVFMFLLSPDSVRSKVCKQEIEHATKNGKRLIPIVVRDINADESPPELKPLNWIFLRESDNFNDAFGKLMAAIKTDYEWVQGHRQLQVKALEWEKSGHENSFLLRGKELQDAEFQLATNSSKKPYPTDLQREYVLKSRQVIDKQRRTITSIAITGVIALAALAVFGFVQAELARNAQATAEANASTAQTAQALAEQQTAVAITRQLAAQSQANSANYPELSLLLAIESMQTSEEALGTYLPAAEQALRQSLSQIKIGGRPLPGNDEPILASAFSPDGRWLTTGSLAGKVYLWDLQSSLLQPTVLQANIKATVHTLKFSQDGHWLATNAGTWDVQNPTKDPIVLETRGTIQALDLSPNGRWQVTSSTDNENGTCPSSLWDMQDLSIAPVVLYNGKSCLSLLIFSPSGKWLAAGTGFDNTFYLWDVQNISSGPLTLQYGDNIKQVAFNPDERWLAFTDDNGIFAWDLQDTFARPKELIRGEISSFAFSTDGKWLATGKGVWNMNDLSQVPIPLDEDFVAMLNFSPDGNWLVTSSRCNIHLRRAKNSFSDNPIVLHGHELINCGAVPNGNWLISLSFSPNGRWLATTDQDSFTWLWDLQNISTEPITLLQGGGINDLAFSPDGRWLGTGSDEEHVVRLWDMQDLTGKPITLEHEEKLIFSPNGRWLATMAMSSDNDFVAQIRDMQNPSKAPILLYDGENIGALVFSPDGRWLATGNRNEGIRLFDAQELSKIPIVLRSEGGVSELAFSQSGQWLASLSGENRDHVDLWDIQTLSLKQIRLSEGIDELNFNPEGMDKLNFSPDERWLAASLDSTNYLMDMSDASNEILLPANFGIYSQNFVFSPTDGHWLATGGQTGVINLWKMDSLDAGPIIIQGNRDPVDSLVFSNDGQRLIAAAAGGSIFLWDMRDISAGITAEPITIQHPNLIGAIALSRDGQWLATGSFGYTMFDTGDRTVRLWHLDPKYLLSLSCRLVGRNFSRTEWARYIPDKSYPTEQKYATCPQWPLEREPILTP